nr:putative ribonuclease H-like domain-containing protein [Tanacetum cinerariifolium]
MDTIRVMLSVASNQGWPIHQFDVKNAFLHGELKKEVYMKALPGFLEHFKPREACRLKKSLYGLKQSPRAWFGRFTLAMKRLKEGLFTKFEMKDLGNLKYFLGIKVLRSCLWKRKLNWLIEIDADWTGDKGNRRSTSGCFSLVRGNLVTWRSKKQNVVSLSSAEAEFRGIAKGLAEALWIRKLVSEIGFPPRRSTQIMCDNKAAIQISENPVQHDRTKHIQVDRHCIKEKLEAGIIELQFVKSSDQLVDILTKVVGTDIFHKCLSKLNFGNLTIQLEGECWKRK